MSTSQPQTALRVGIFLTVASVILAFAIVLLGSKSGLFARKATLYASFENVNGLVVGAPVRLAGLDVGRVSKIMFSDDLRQREARLELAIQERYFSRLRSDSRAFIDSKGLLGDKLINITIGSPDQPPLREGDLIPTRPALSIEELAAQVKSAVSAITHVSDRAGALLEGLAEPHALADLQRILHSTAGILEGVEHADGVAHRLIYDSAYADQVAGILQEAQRSLAALRGSLEHVEHVAREVRGGRGALHELIYGQRGAQTFADLQAAASELSQLVRDVRQQPGLLHSLIYDPQSGEMLAQWNDFSARINRLSRNLEQGQGTLGGLLVDPSVYEDLKSMLGNIERNVVFKALVRYTIKEDDLQRPARMPASTVTP
jgi:phospholipid/cholesterol/gamma-HCH transport system substrate-binding protein